MNIILKEVSVIGRVQNIRSFGNQRAIQVYLGNSAKDDEPDNHMNATVFVSAEHKSLDLIAENTVIQAVGTVVNRTNKAGFKEIVVNPTSLFPVNSGFAVKWGLYPSKSANVFISGIFPNSNGGYDISGKYDIQEPKISYDGSIPKIEYVKDDRPFKTTCSSSSRAKSSIDKAISKLTGRDVQGQASESELKELSKCTAILNISFATIKSRRSSKNDVNGWDYYLNTYADDLMLINRIGNRSETSHRQSSTHQQAIQPQNPEQPTQEEMMTPPPLETGDPGFDESFDTSVMQKNQQAMPADFNASF
tara:strand:+ start:30401 stop:31318 length:918 start_codon:yes stop_codon:yes gene_type:complete